MNKQTWSMALTDALKLNNISTTSAWFSTEASIRAVFPSCEIYKKPISNCTYFLANMHHISRLSLV